MSAQDKRAIEQCILVYCVAALLMGFAVSLWAEPILPSQEAVNATFQERFAAMSLRLDKIESMLNYALLAVFGNLIAHLFQISMKGK